MKIMDNKKPFRKAFTESASRKGLGIFIAVIFVISVFAFAMPAKGHSGDVIYSSWTTTPPDVDGIFSVSEWKNAQLLIEDPIHTYVYFSLGGTNPYELYICVDAANEADGDYTENDADYCTLHFDTDHDGLWTEGHEDVFVLYGDGRTEHWVASSPAYTLHCRDWSGNHSGLQGAAGFGGSPNAATPHRIYEFKIPLNLLTYSPGDTIGFASPIGLDSLPHDAATGRHNVWPPGAVINDLTTWGDLVLASPPPVPLLTPIGLIILVGLLSVIAAISIRTSIRKKRR